MTDAQGVFDLFLGTLGNPPEPPLRVVAFRGREALSQVPRFRVQVLADPAFDGREASLLGDKARLVLRTGEGAVRTIGGVVTAVLRGTPAHRGPVPWTLTIEPAFARLRHRRNSRIFQDKTNPEILAEMLSGAGVPFELALTSRYGARPYAVQYEESDHDFVRRIAAEEGLAFVFLDAGNEDPKAPEGAMRFFDSPDGYVGGATPRQLAVVDDAAREAGDAAYDVRRRDRDRPRKLTLRDYDFQRPQHTLEHAVEAEEGIHEVYEHHGRYDAPEVAEARASVWLEQLRRRALRVEGRSRVRGLAAGQVVWLDAPHAAGVDGPHALVAIDHRGEVPELMGAAGRGVTYEAHFKAIPASAVERPRATRRTLQQVLETATVVGPAGQEVHTDEHARIKVQFHWDREGKLDEHSSAWVRVAQTWAGASFGAQFIPRIGMEALVGFLGGDADRPVVVGCLYNATHPPPFPLPVDKLKSGIRTRTSPGEGSNELSFDDRAGREKVLLVAQKDHEESVTRDQRIQVGGQRIVEVGGSVSERVTGDRTLRTVGSVLEQTVGRRTEEVAEGVRQVVGVSRSATIHGEDRLDVRGASITTVAKATAVAARGGLRVEVGSEAEKSAAEAVSWGPFTLTTADRLELHADRAIALVVGDTRVELTPEGLTFSASKITLAAAKGLVAKGDGPTLSLGKDVSLTADAVRFYSKKASLELDDKAHLNGQEVRLNCGAQDPEEAKDEEGEPLLQHFKLKLTDPDFEPYAGKPFILRAAGMKVEGTTDGDGCVECDIPKEADSADITLWLGERPTGETRQYVVRIAPLPPASEPAGAKLRLKNLGYLQGSTDGPLDERTSRAIRTFQADHDLDPTGELDPKTQGELVHVFGS